MRGLVELSRPMLNRKIEAAWIWRVAIHSRETFFLEGFLGSASNMLLLRNIGMELLATCPVYGLEDESTKHAILHYPRARLI